MIQVKKISELTGHSGPVYSLESSETENCFYSGSSDKIIAKWNLDSLRPEKFAAQLPGIIYSLCFVDGEKLLLAGTSEGKIHVIDLTERKEIRILQNHIQPVFDIQLYGPGRLIVSAGGDGVLSIIRPEDFSTFKLFKLCKEKLRAIAIQGSHAAVACGDGAIRIIDLEAFKITHEFPAHTGSVYALQFSPDGKHLLSGGKDAHLNIWQTAKGEWQPVRSIPAHNYAIYKIAYNNENHIFATCSRDKTIKIWNVDNFEVLARINKENYEGHINSVNTILWNKNNLLVTAGDDRKIMCWGIIE